MKNTLRILTPALVLTTCGRTHPMEGIRFFLDKH